jgi:molybdopterin-guanine dinucleotide biosynthesis protein A
MEKYGDVTGVILVGGRSARMGRDKALLPFEGATLFEKALDVLKRHLETIFLVGDRPERFAKYGLRVYPDIFPGSALGGLHTALYRATTPFVFVSPCDLPFASPDVLQYLLSLREGRDVVVPMASGYPEPLFALYSRNCLEPMRELLESGNFRIFDFYPRVRVRRVPGAELAPIAGSERAFLNVNTMEEYERILGEEKNDR